MKKSTVDKLQKSLLIFVAIGLIPIALGYGLMPEKSMSYLFDLSVTETNLSHILRAVMGLYLALVIFWLMGAFNTQLRQAALYSLVVFMFGLAGGRILSLFVDGVPNWLLVVYLALELLFGILGLVLVRKSTQQE
jgi:predicted membrane protein